MQKKKRLRAIIPFLITVAALAACGQDERAPQERFATVQQPLPCLPLDEFTPLLTPNGWRVLTTPPGNSGDITNALQQAVQDIAVSTGGITRPTIYIPPGNWTISHTIQMEYGYAVNIVGADPATTKITWVGPAASAALSPPSAANGNVLLDPNKGSDMFRIIDVSNLKFNRLTLDGGGTARIGVQVVQSLCYKTAIPVPPVPPAMTSGLVDKSACNLSPVTPAGLSLAVTGLEFNDDVFQNLQYGITGGSEAAYRGDDNSIAYLDSGLGTYPDPDYPGVISRRAVAINQGDVLIRRSRFHSIAQHGVNIWGANAFNWLIADSEFSDCYRGVAVGAHGGASVIGNRFAVNGQIAINGMNGDPSYTQGVDIMIAGDTPSAIRGNVSSGSRKFLRIAATGSVSAGDVSGNYISTSPPGGAAGTPVPAISSYLTQLTLFDNYIETTQSIAVQTAIPAGGTGGSWTDSPRVTHGGNSFKTTNTIACNTDCTPVGPAGTCSFLKAENTATPSIAKELDAGGNQCTSSPSIPPAAASAFATALTPVAAPDGGRTVSDVSQPLVVNGVQTNIATACAFNSTANMCGALINAWLAAQTSASRPLLFFPAGPYYLEKPIEIPGDLDVVIAGDGNRSQLFWIGADSTQPDQYMIHVHSPAKALLRDFIGYVNRPATTRPGGILIDSADDSGGLVFIDTMNTYYAKSVIDVLGLDNVTVRADLAGGSEVERVLGVTGGGKAAPTSPGEIGASSRTKGLLMFAGGSGSLSSYIQLKNWGKAVLIGVDNEAAPQGTVLDQSGYLTMNESRLLPGKQLAVYETFFAEQPNMVVQSTFRGRLTLMNMCMTAGIVAQAASSEAQVLSLSNFFQPPNTSVFAPVMPAICTLAPIDCSFYNRLGPTGGQSTRMALQNGTTCSAGTVWSYCNDYSQSATAVAFVNAMLTDTRAAPAAPPAACSNTAVRLHRVYFQGLSSLQGPSNFMGPAIRVQRF